MNEECWPLINTEYVLVLGSPRECGLILTLEMYQAQIMIKKKRGWEPMCTSKDCLTRRPTISQSPCHTSSIISHLANTWAIMSHIMLIWWPNSVLLEWKVVFITYSKASFSKGATQLHFSNEWLVKSGFRSNPNG